jgi:uncharacterized membrane protein
MARESARLEQPPSAARSQRNAYGTATVPTGVRHEAIDAVRGSVMVIMALDHVRDFVHSGAMNFQPEDLAETTPILFLTRWVTHICAPAFVLLAGIAANRRLQRAGSAAPLSVYLAVRGLWLIVVELTLIRFALNFRYGSADPWLLLVLCALGLSMMVLAPVVRLPTVVLSAAGLAVILLHNTLDNIRAADLGALGPFWMLLHQQGVFVVAGQVVLVAYPMLPWAGLLAVGFAAGGLFDLAPGRRRSVLAFAGNLLILSFLALRWWNGYGDPQPWSSQATPLMTALSFLRTTKYPPSLAFMLMTVGPTLLALAWFERRTPGPRHPLVVIGRVPLFYYVGHFFAAHFVASCLVWWHYGDFSLAFLSGPFPSMGGPRAAFPADFGWPLWAVYVVWVAVVLLMYPACRWFARLKRERRWWWLAYA